MKTLASNPDNSMTLNQPVSFRNLHHATARLFGVVFAGLLLFSTQGFAQGFEVISPAQNTSDSEKVEVLEFFWFGCPHCNAFEPSIEEWAANIPENTVFVREAPALNQSWEAHSKAFYAAEILGIGDEFLPAMFKSIHQDKKRMRKPSDIAELAATFGVEEDAFIAAMDSFGVKTRMNRALQLARGTGITGVPAIIVNGKYRINTQSAGSHAGMIAAINQTVESEKQSMGLE